jgi:3-dehydroquinate dehydratase
VSTRAPEAGGNVAAIKDKTDHLTFTTANKVDSRVDHVGATSVTEPNDLKADVSNLDVAVSTRSPESGGNIAAIRAKTDNLPSGIAKNVALNNFEFVMVDSADHITPKTALSVIAEISKDGGSFASCTNAATEVGNGVYKINLTQAEMNANVITLKFTATDADQRTITIFTS